jgi:hypothetical protein
MGAHIQTLRRRIPDIPEATLTELAGELAKQRVLTGIGSGMMSGSGAEDMRGAITPTPNGPWNFSNWSANTI